MKTPIQIACDTMDWLQVVYNGGPPCFHLEEGRRFCGRAQRWFGHSDSMHGHAFTSLSELVSDAFTAGERKGRIAGLREAAELCSGDSHIEEGIRAEADRLEREEGAK